MRVLRPTAQVQKRNGLAQVYQQTKTKKQTATAGQKVHQLDSHDDSEGELAVQELTISTVSANQDT